MSSKRSIARVLAGRARYALIRGDCLELMFAVPPASVDLVLSDLPYGMTDCEWDRVLPFEVLWWHYARVLKPEGAAVLTASQPFTTRLASSRMKWFRYEWVWDKVNRSTGFPNARKRPLKAHENVLVFCRRQPAYNPQMTAGRPYRSRRGSLWKGLHSPMKVVERRNAGERYPTSIIRIPAAGGEEHTTRGLHPTQKPVALMEYLIRTYTKPGELVLDSCMGSGTTGVACLRTGRRFIGMELDPEYFKTATQRTRAEARRVKRSA